MNLKEDLKKLNSLSEEKRILWREYSDKAAKASGERILDISIEYFDKILSIVKLDLFHCFRGLYTLQLLNQENSRDIQKHKEAISYFKKANVDILHVYSRMQQARFKQEYISFVLKLMLEDDAFFKKNTAGFKGKKKEFFEDIYLKSLQIVNLLHVNREEENYVAHYTTKGVCELLAFTESKLRLNTITTANDPEEGLPLMRFLEMEKDTLKEEHQAFITSFIFNPDCLNQFRLYGKENGEEATGVSVVIAKDFFSDEPAISPALAFDKDIKHDSEPLFRCIYIDPMTRKVISVGHKDEQIFYRENIKTTPDEIKEYKDHIDKLVGEVREQLESLKEDIRKFTDSLKDKRERIRTEEVVGELLIHLRYLVKHVAFKEEQECRIIKVVPLKKPKKESENIIHIDAGSSRMYIEYEKLRDKKEKTCYISDIYFGPKATGIKLFRDIIKHEGLSIRCHQSDHPYL